MAKEKLRNCSNDERNKLQKVNTKSTDLNHESFTPYEDSTFNFSGSKRGNISLKKTLLNRMDEHISTQKYGGFKTKDIN